MALRLAVYRPGWRITWFGWLVGLLVLWLIVIGGARMLYPFLAVSHPVKSQYLVVEGWLPDTAIEQTIAEMKRGEYSRVYLTGGEMLKSDPASRLGSYPELMRAMLIKHQVPADLLVAVTSLPVAKDRTYASAEALRQRFRHEGLAIASFNLLTYGPHARRSWLLFEKAFGPGTRIGVVAIVPGEFDPRAWWRTSAGFREVIDETIAYVYARCLFHP